jgi:hypothetical protein
VVEVLGAALLVDADGLQRRRVAAGDAHVLPRRRDAQPGDPPEDFLVLDGRAIGQPVGESLLFAAFAPDPVQFESPTAPNALSRHLVGFGLRDRCLQGETEFEN